ncbi:hypothetical protein LSI54_06710 [Nesterenkonia sp. AY15]|uniref:dimethylamine monooxygenase subunit DmmA family protein n=1 Tax=Nesterenkonia sp. AY15 TaxID=2901139 RepID=UPI001F4C8BBB|nr:dimethylamine monooxygenase subunit DmmA family protein [Nesterenkonia sp. AY15]MCH8571049.1 hypothetical protein [Nesterenkonia sp. AY15]
MASVLDHTSIPAWARAPAAQPVDPAAASCTILTYGSSSLAAGWSSELTDLGIEHRIVALATGDSAQEQLIMAEELQRAVVGWRLMIVGPLADVLRARSLALQAGLLGAEIIVSTTDVDRIEVSCAHCAATTLTTARPAQIIACHGCSETLVVHHHLSPLRGSLLGSKHDAEQRLEARREPA